jgi:hypothetical protein
VVTPEPSLHDDGLPARQQPLETAERRVAGWQRALRWVAWLTFLGLAVWNSQNVYFSPLEWLALAAAIGISIFCLAKPMGGPKVELTEPEHLIGPFVSRTNWGLVLFGAILTIGGIAASGAIVYDMSTGRASFGDVLTDIGVFIEGWIAELISGGGFDAELEKTHAYALFLLLIPGIPLVWYNLLPFFKRGTEFRVEHDGSVAVRRGAEWPALLEYEYSMVTADGTAIEFAPSAEGGQALTFPQQRVFSRECGVRLPSETSAEFFRHRLSGRGFTLAEGANRSSFVARRNP